MTDSMLRQGFMLVLLIVLQSCGSYRVFRGSVQQDASKRNDIIRSDELASYLASRNRLKFTLRSPEGYDGFSEEDKATWKDLSNQIEMELIKQGHIVKDRKLISELIDKQNVDGPQVGRIVSTDIIIELIDFDLDIENHLTEFSIKEKGITSDFSNWENIDFVDCRLAMLECRIMLAEVGNVGGIFKIFISGCDTDREFYIKIYENNNGEPDQERESFVGWNYGNVSFKSLTYTYNMNSLSREKAIERLVAALLKELSTGTNAGNRQN